jgi:hypothetical protein
LKQRNSPASFQLAWTKETDMTKRVSQFWLPGLVTLLLSMGFLALIQIFGSHPWMVARHRNQWSLVAPVAVIYLPWLLSLPLVGAIGAYLSQRAGGTRQAVFCSIVFPVVPYLGLFLLGFPIALIIEDNVAHNLMFATFFVGLLAWVLAPGAALLLGGWSTQLLVSRWLGSRQIAGS